MIVLGLILLVLAAFLLSVGAVAAARKLPGNNYIGLRVEEVRKDQRTWEVAHAVAGPIWMLGGVSLVFGGIIALGAQGWMWVLPIISVIVAVLAVSVGSNMGARAAFLQDRLNEEEDKQPPKVNLTALRAAAKHADKSAK